MKSGSWWFSGLGILDHSLSSGFDVQAPWPDWGSGRDPYLRTSHPLSHFPLHEETRPLNFYSKALGLCLTVLLIPYSLSFFLVPSFMPGSLNCLLTSISESQPVQLLLWLFTWWLLFLLQDPTHRWFLWSLFWML